MYGYNGYFEANIRLKSDNMKIAENSSTFIAYVLMVMMMEHHIYTMDINLIHFLCIFQDSKVLLDVLCGQEMGWRHKLDHIV